MGRVEKVSSLHYQQPGQQQGLVAGAAVHPLRQQDTALPLMVQHQSQQRHHQDKDDGAADHCVRDAGVIAQTIVQSAQNLSRRLCGRKAVLFIAVVLTVVLTVAQKTAVHTPAVGAVEA